MGVFRNEIQIGGYVTVLYLLQRHFIIKGDLKKLGYLRNKSAFFQFLERRHFYLDVLRVVVLFRR
jgi:hypothetical protein